MTRFVHITDLHVSHPDAGDTYLRTDTPKQVAEAVAAINRLTPAPDFVIASGDLTNIGDPLSYGLLQDILSPLAMPVVLALGNHDKREGFHASFGTGLGDAPYFHDRVIGGFHVITLDTLVPGKVAGTLGDDQFDFLAQALTRHTDLPRLVVAHHPPMLHGGELPWATLDQTATDRLAAALAGQNVLGVFSGHVHLNGVRMWNGIPVYISIGLNSTVDLIEREDMILTEGTGFTLFDLRDTGLTATFIPLTPKPREIGRIDVARLRAFS